jgi:hypothetical protein
MCFRRACNSGKMVFSQCGAPRKPITDNPAKPVFPAIRLTAIYETFRVFLEAAQVRGLQEHRCLNQVVKAEIVLLRLSERFGGPFPNLRYAQKPQSPPLCGRRRVRPMFPEEFQQPLKIVAELVSHAARILSPWFQEKLD